MKRNSKNSEEKNRRVRRPKTVAPRITSEASAPTQENRSALRLVRSLRVSNNKYINTTLTSFPAQSITLTTPYVNCLNAVPPGTGENNRIGRICKMLWLDIDLDFFTGGFDATALIRCYIVVETTALGSALSPSQFFVDNSNFSALSQRDRTNRNASRYFVLYDSKPIVLAGLPTSSGLTAPSSVGANPAETVRSLHIPLNFETDYSRGTAGTIGDIDSNSLSILIVTDNGAANQMYCQGAWTLCFTDSRVN